MVASIRLFEAGGPGLLGATGCVEDLGGGTIVAGARDFSKLDTIVETSIARWNASSSGRTTPIRGASLVIVDKEDGIVYTQGYGGYAAERLYLIASASKILSAGVLMKLQDQGKLDIDRPISEYLQDWGQHKTAVTTAQLLSNSAGMPTGDEVIQNYDTPEGEARYAAHVCEWYPDGTLADCGKSAYQDDLPENNQPPDTTFRYGGSQWQLAGALAEQISGKSWAQLIEETYVEPCGVTTLGFTNQAQLAPDYTYPSSFAANAANAPVTENPLIEGGAYITGPDYAKLLQMHLRGGVCGENRVLSESAVARMRTDRVAAYGGDPRGEFSLFNGYGLGWWLAADYIADAGAYGTIPIINAQSTFGLILLLEATNDAGWSIMETLGPAVDELMQ